MQQDIRLQRLLHSLPSRARQWYLWLAQPKAKYLRWLLGCLLILGGILGFLPILGFWMIPLGVLLIGQDIPAAQRIALRLLDWLRRQRSRR